jgi:periplasmic protein TonB
MNRLQKKCVIATAGIHLLLLLILVFGSAFFNPESKPDNTKLLDMIPSTTIDALFSSGVRGVTPPPPTPIVNPPPPLPPPPAPAVQPPPQPPPPTPVVKPEPTVMDRVKEIFTPEPKPEPVKPAPEKAEPQPHKIQVNTQLVQRTAPKNPTPTSKPDNTRNNTAAINKAIQNIRNNLKPGTVIDMPGDSTVAYANYASVVKSIYDAAWTLPDTIAKDENVTVKVTIASDGTVISSRIIERSGDAPVDASVQRTLDRVTFVAPFPEGSSDKQRTYTINFNPQIKKSE